jgi:hypothetical protein
MRLNLFLLCAFFVSDPCAMVAKGPTRRLEISGADRVVPLEIRSPAALVSVWSDDFFDGLSPPPETDLPRYRVAFYVLSPGESVERLMYVVDYVRDPQSGTGFVYLPGRGEKGYELNVRTILRAEHDGRWHHARPAWSTALNSALDVRVLCGSVAAPEEDPLCSLGLCGRSSRRTRW